jgi:hypothetical protein
MGERIGLGLGLRQNRGFPSDNEIAGRPWHFSEDSSPMARSSTREWQAPPERTDPDRPPYRCPAVTRHPKRTPYWREKGTPVWRTRIVERSTAKIPTIDIDLKLDKKEMAVRLGDKTLLFISSFDDASVSVSEVDLRPIGLVVYGLPIRLTHTPTSGSDLISVAGARPRFAELMGTLFQLGDTGMNAPTPIVMDINQHAALPFPQSLPEFQRLFPDDVACAAYLEKLRWQNGFVCPHCRMTGVPFHIATRPGVLTCRKCRRQTGLTVGTVMERSHTPLSAWFWAAYLVASQTPGMSAVRFNANLGSRGMRQLFGFSTLRR